MLLRSWTSLVGSRPGRSSRRTNPGTRAVTFACVLGALLAPPQARAAADDLAALSDEFDDATTLTRWQRYPEAEGWPSMLSHVDIGETHPGQLRLQPITSCWYGDFHAPVLFKEVTGDFVVVARVIAEGLTIDVPIQRWSMGGLIARAPSHVSPKAWKPGGENWLLLTYGLGKQPRKASYEFKNTVGSETTLEEIPSEWSWVELAMARVGPTFVLFYRAGDSPWKVAARQQRDDLPKTLQVGITAYTDWFSAFSLHDDPLAFNRTEFTKTHPDLVVSVDYVRFARPAIPPDVDRASLMEPDVSDADLVGWLLE
jgi:hypothetical protein